MTKRSLYKILAFFALLAELVIFFILIGKLTEIEQNLGDINKNNLLVLLGIAIGLIVLLFIITILTTYQQSSEDKYSRDKIASLTEEEKRKTFDETSEENEQLNVENYLKRIIPNVTPKMELEKFTEKVLSNIAKEFDVVQGLFFVKEKESDVFNIAGKYAYFGDEEPKSFNTGEALSGQVAKNKKALILKDIPENYVTILSGLGSSTPDHVIIIPVISDDIAIAIIELASFKEFKSNFINLFEGMSEEIAKALMKF